MIKLKENIYFSSKTEDMNLEIIFEFVKNSYWGELRTFEEQKIAIESSINFGLFKEGKQIAYARVMTDKVFFAYLLDVFVVKEEQGKGYSKLIIDKTLNFPEIKDVGKWMLATRDAHSLYEKFDFHTVKSPEKLMEKLSEKARVIYE